jgi:hypothetical protein
VTFFITIKVLRGQFIFKGKCLVRLFILVIFFIIVFIFSVFLLYLNTFVGVCVLGYTLLAVGRHSSKGTELNLIVYRC